MLAIHHGDGGDSSENHFSLTAVSVIVLTCEVIVTLVALLFAVRAFRTLLVRRDDIARLAMAASMPSRYGSIDVRQSAPRLDRWTNSRGGPGSQTGTGATGGVRRGVGQSSTAGTLRAGAAEPTQLATHRSHHSDTTPAAGESARPSEAARRARVTDDPPAQYVASSLEPDVDGDGEGATSRATPDELGTSIALSDAQSDARLLAGTSTRRPNDPQQQQQQVKAPPATAARTSGDDALHGPQPQSVTGATLLHRSTRHLRRSTGGALASNNMYFEAISGHGGGWLAGPDTLADPESNPMLLIRRVQHEDSERSLADWRLDVLTDRHVTFYFGCILTGLACSAVVLAILMPHTNVATMSKVVNAATAFATTCDFSAIALLLTLLNHWELDQRRSFHARRVPFYLIVTMWLAVFTAVVLGSTSSTKSRQYIPVYVCGGFAGALFVACLWTALYTVPWHCRKMHAALLVLEIALGFKVTLNVPSIQLWFTSQTTTEGAVALWGALCIIPLFLAFETIHWQRPQIQQQ